MPNSTKRFAERQNWPQSSSDSTVLHFHYSKFISHLDGTQSLFFSSSLQRDVIFLAVVGSLIDITIRVSPDHPSNFSKDKDNIKDKDITSRVSPDHPSNYFWPIGFLQLTAVKCFMLQQTSFDYRSPPMRKNTRRLSYFSFSNPVLTSFPQTGRKIELDAFFFCSGDGSSGKDQPFIVAQHEAGPR